MRFTVKRIPFDWRSTRDRALRAAREDAHASWTTIAAATGYYDQAHLIAEFRAIADATPSALLSELRATQSVG
jgi:AraC-like DNA-binding protein